MLKSRKAPASTDSRRTTQEIYDVLNQLISAVNRQESKAGPRDTEGKGGDMRLVQDTKGSYALELRFKDGWVRSPAGSFVVSQNATPKGGDYHGITVYTPPPEEVFEEHVNELQFNGIE